MTSARLLVPVLLLASLGVVKVPWPATVLAILILLVRLFRPFPVLATATRGPRRRIRFRTPGRSTRVHAVAAIPAPASPISPASALRRAALVVAVKRHHAREVPPVSCCCVSGSDVFWWVSQWWLVRLVARELPCDVRHWNPSARLQQSRSKQWRQPVQWTYSAILQHAALLW
jgi:hypothetical protein